MDIEILTDKIEVGEGGGETRVVVAKGPQATWTMEQIGDDVPVLPSKALARTLGYGRDRALHALAKRLYPEEKDFSRASKLKSDTDPGVLYYRLSKTGRRGRPTKEYLLTYRQVLKISMRAETDRASAIQDEMVNALLAIYHGEILIPVGRRTAPQKPTPAPKAAPHTDPVHGRLAKHYQACERKLLIAALRKHHGHNTDTAKWLGVSRRTLYYKMRFYGLEGEASAMRTEAGIMGPRLPFAALSAPEPVRALRSARRWRVR